MKPQRTPSFYAKTAKKRLCDLCDSFATFAVKKRFYHEFNDNLQFVYM